MKFLLTVSFILTLMSCSSTPDIGGVCKQFILGVIDIERNHALFVKKKMSEGDFLLTKQNSHKEIRKFKAKGFKQESLSKVFLLLEKMQRRKGFTTHTEIPVSIGKTIINNEVASVDIHLGAHICQFKLISEESWKVSSIQCA